MLGHDLIEHLPNRVWCYSVHLGEVKNWCPMDAWCLYNFGREGKLWRINWEQGTWDFKTQEDAVMMELAWAK
jgi:hypothetical protein